MKKKTFRFNIYYSSPYYRLHDGDDKGPEVYRTASSIDIHEKQIELEEKYLNEKNSK